MGCLTWPLARPELAHDTVISLFEINELVLDPQTPSNQVAFEL